MPKKDDPSMAETLGNGYAITAVIGKREIMEAAQSTFISSTFWTERIGPSAALKTLEVMERDSRKMRGERPFVFTNLKTGQGLDTIVEFIQRHGLMQ